MVIFVNAVKPEDNRNAVVRVVEMAGAEKETIRFFQVVVFVVVI